MAIGMQQIVALLDIDFGSLPVQDRDMIEATIGSPSVDTGSLAFLYSLVEKIKPKPMLEVGLATGSSASCHALAASGSLERFHIIDPMQTIPFQNTGLKNVKKCLGDNLSMLRFHEESSHFVMPRMAKAQMSFDYIFIDGDHRHDATMVDVFFADHLLEIGGLLVIDDRVWPMVGAVVDFMKQNYRHYECILDHPRLSVFIKKSEDKRDWFDFWYFEVPENPKMYAKIDEYRLNREQKGSR